MRSDRQEHFWYDTSLQVSSTKSTAQSQACPSGPEGRGALDEETRTDTVNRIADPGTFASAAVWETEWEQHVMRTALERVKAKVSVKQFQLFDLHVLQGLSVPETARVLSTSRAAVYMAASRLRRILRKEVTRLSDRGL